MRTSPPSDSVRLTTRTKPWRPSASDAEGNNATPCVVTPSSPDPALSGTVDRLVRCPVGLYNRLITSMGCFDVTSSRHLPSPVPSAPLTPCASPDSNSLAPSVRDAPSASVSSTAPCDDFPSSSIPSMRTSVSSAPGLTTRSRLTCLSFRPGLNVTTSCPASPDGATSCIAVRKPSVVRM